MFVKEIISKEYDVAIVGTGPAGISLALRLSEQSKAKILLIESGALESKPEIYKLSEVEATGDLSSNYYPVHAQRNFGGASNIWGGWCTTIEKRAFLNGEWPIKYEDIRPYYKDAADILELPEEAFQSPTQNITKESNIIYRPYYLSPPVRFNKKYEAYLRDSNNIHVLLHNTCTKILSNENIIEALLVQESEGHSTTTHQVKAKHYILACGGIGNPRLLLLAGIASESPVGNYFMEHPHIYGAGELELSKKVIFPIIGSESGWITRALKRRVYPALGIVNKRMVLALQFSDEYCLKNNLLNFTVSFERGSIEDRAFLGNMKSMYVSKVDIRSEMPPQAKNMVSLSAHLDHLKQPKTHVNFKFDYQKLAKKSWESFAKELLASGIGRATTPPDLYKVTGGGHFIGTTRMGTAVNNSVVDANCKVHNVNNLYVTGSSVFSASAAANPTFSIVAFALRLADHLSMKLQGETLL